MHTFSQSLARLLRGSPLWLLLCLLPLGGCFLKPHKIDVQQGNYVDQEMIAKLRPDMTRSQVRFIMGTPLVADMFHPDRWDYLYLDRKKGKLKETRRVTLLFENDRLKRAITDLPAPTVAQATPPTAPAGQPVSPASAAPAQPVAPTPNPAPKQ